MFSIEKIDLKKLFSNFTFPEYYKNSGHIYSDKYYNLMYSFAKFVKSRFAKNKKFNLLILGGLYGCSTKSIVEALGDSVKTIEIVDNGSEYKGQNDILKQNLLQDYVFTLYDEDWRKFIKDNPDTYDFILIDNEISKSSVEKQLDWAFKRCSKKGGVIVDDLANKDVRAVVENFEKKNSDKCTVKYIHQPDSWTGMAFILKDVIDIVPFDEDEDEIDEDE